jgi:glutaminase
VHAAGDAGQAFTIMSVAKPFVLALACAALGPEQVRKKIGVNATGLPFSPLAAVERGRDGVTNPMVNPGAIAATSLLPGDTADAKWGFLARGLSAFAGRELKLDEDVYASAAACRCALAVMATAGMYETSGDWLYEVGVPGKSGIGGGIVTVAPGKGGLGTFSPPLDRAGNSVRGQLAARFLSRRLGLSLFASRPADQAGTVPRQSKPANP